MVAMLDLWDNSTGLNFVTWPWPPRLCITWAFADGKLQRWRTTGLSTINIWQKGYPYGDVYIMKNLTDTFIGGEYRKCKHIYSDVFPIERRLVYNRSFALNFPKETELLWFGLGNTTCTKGCTWRWITFDMQISLWIGRFLMNVYDGQQNK